MVAYIEGMSRNKPNPMCPERTLSFLAWGSIVGSK